MKLAALLTLLPFVLPAGAFAVEVSPEIRAVVENSTRSEADRGMDARRRPAELLAFAGVKPGMRVLDLGASGGYTTELLARAVGPKGHVYAQNSSFVMERFVKGKFDERAAKPEMKNVSHSVREFDEPVPPGARNLDLVTAVFVYHDRSPEERSKMNQAMFDALKSGGHYVVVDHAAKAGAGDSQTKTLHRIDEGLVRKEVESAGFKFVEEGGFLRHPEDSREEHFSKNPGKVDQFALKFVKP